MGDKGKQIQIHSVKDAQGRILTDCTECAKGWNGDMSCDRGWHHDQPKRGSCFCGDPLPGVLAALEEKPRLPMNGGA